MLSGLTGRRPTIRAVTRAGLLTAGLLLGLGLSACTTTEGTNALSDIGTFEREVLTETMKGMGVHGARGEGGAPSAAARWFCPRPARCLRRTEASRRRAAAQDFDQRSDRHLQPLGGRPAAPAQRPGRRPAHPLGPPLTDVEAKQLTARMTAAKLNGGPRPLYLPPEEYFTTVKGQDTGLPRRQWRAGTAHRQGVPAGNPQGPAAQAN